MEIVKKVKHDEDALDSKKIDVLALHWICKEQAESNILALHQICKEQAESICSVDTNTENKNPFKHV